MGELLKKSVIAILDSIVDSKKTICSMLMIAYENEEEDDTDGEE